MEDQQEFKDEREATQLPAKPEAKELVLQKITAIENLLIQDLSAAKDSLTLRDKSIERLQQVIYEHEKRIFSNINESLLRELCLYKDKLDRVTNRFAEASSTIISELNYLGEEFEDLLYGLGVTAIEQDGSIYDRTTQKAKTHIPTDDSTLHHTVLEVLKPGYVTGDKTLRKQEVSIYTHQKTINHE